jgi:hypothetical protein
MRSLLSIPASMWRGHSCPRNAYSKIASAENSCCRILIILLLLAAFTTSAAAQRSPRGGFASGRFAHSSRLARRSPYEALPFPFLGDSFNLQDLYSSGYPVASQPPVIFLQAAGALSETSIRSESREPSPIQPLTIELQNGRYVRVANSEVNGDALPLTLPAQLATNSHAATPSPAITAPPAQNPAPAVLIFQDGHTEEVRDYTIAAGVLYARGDYYNDGYWLKQISLTTLNLSQTLQANASRGVKFSLPSSPNEVITRF